MNFKRYRMLSLEIEDRVAVLRLNRPDSRNAMNDEMAGEFADAVRALGARDDAGALVVTGSGPAFCAGGDLEGFAKWEGADPSAVEAGLLQFYGSFLAVLDLSIPTLAAVNGPAVGAGACLAAACDLRIAAEGAGIGFTFVNLGINPGMGAEYLLTRLVGPALAFELLMTGEILPAEEAFRIGLFNRVVSKSRLMETAVETGRAFGRMHRSISQVVKTNIAAAGTEPVSAVLRREAANQAPIFTDPDFQRTIRKMLEKIGSD